MVYLLEVKSKAAMKISVVYFPNTRAIFRNMVKAVITAKAQKIWTSSMELLAL